MDKTTSLLVQTAAVPAVSDGRPVMPPLWVKSDSAPTVLVGPKHLHSIKDPDPIWDPNTGGWSNPPPPVKEPVPVAKALWSVRDLPDPAHFNGGFYWLGDPSLADGTQNIQAACRQWSPSGSSPQAPAWRSFFPYKPSVRAYDAFLPGGTVVHHPKGVHFNSQFIEHMWMTFAGNHYQAYTWIVCAMVVNFPDAGYAHILLDSGRNPDAVHFPRISAAQCDTPRRIADGLVGRQLLAVRSNGLQLGADSVSNRQVRATVASAIRPKMYVGIWNGTHSYVGAYSPGMTTLKQGTVNNTHAAQIGRYYVMGRENNWISQDHASHMLVFEMRFYGKALDAAELRAQYNQLSATYQFNKYRAL